MLLAHPASAVEITNFRSGLACTNSAINGDTTGWICQPTEDIPITDQGRCVYADKEILCTWFGFEFDYRSRAGETKLLCKSETSIPTDSGNPKEVLEQDATSHQYQLDLKGGSGRFYNPQYFGFQVRPANDSLIVVNGSCQYDGAEVFQYRFNLRFPTMPAVN